MMRKVKFPLALLLITGFSLTLITGCGTLGNGRGWGQDAIYPVNSERVSHAFYNACLDWGTLVPAAGALVSSLDQFDERVSSWATGHTQIFGSMDSASRTANYLLEILQAEVLVTALATPSGQDSKEWVYSKAKGLSVELGAELATDGATEALKDITDRPRPGGGGSSLPSGHSSSAFTSAVLANRNLKYISMSDNLRFALEAGNVLLASATAWARVEANAHYLSDVLLGAAVGYFSGAFIHDAFMGLPEEKSFHVHVTPLHGGGMVVFSFPF
jgi:hypothetical protein